MPRPRLTSAPILDGLKGQFRVARRFTPASTTTAGILWALRNPTASTVLAVLLRARLRAIQVGAPSAAIEDRFNLTIARSYTVMDTTNGTDIAPTTGKQKLRATMADAALQIRESSAAGGASGGTKTLDPNPIATGSFWVLAALPTGEGRAIDIFDYAPDPALGEHPLVLAADEGVVIQNENAFGATSGIVLQLETVWAEVSRY